MKDEEDFGIDNVQIENFIKKSDDNISKSFVGVFPADEKTDSTIQVSKSRTK